MSVLTRTISKKRLLNIIDNINTNVIKHVELFVSNDILDEVTIGTVHYILEKNMLDGPDRDALSEIIFKLKELSIEFIIFNHLGYLIGGEHE